MKGMNALIGVDLGTTGCRSVVFDEGLNILGEKYIEYPLIKLSHAEIEQDANLWWELSKQAIKGSIYKAGIPIGGIKSISISSQGIAFVPVDRDCKPLRNAISWLDTRAKEQLNKLLERYNKKDIYRRTGKRADETYVLPKLLWIKEHEPEIYLKTFKFLMAHDFVTSKLCGRYVTDHTMASGTLIYDISEQKWSNDVINNLGLDANKLPEIKWSGTALGFIRGEVAHEIGLKDNVVIAVGGQDQKCAALGAGITDGVAAVSLGTATAITIKWNNPILDLKMRIPCFSDLFKNKWVTEGVVGTSCASLKWLKQTLFPEKSYKELDLMVENVSCKTNELFFYPYLAGKSSPNWYENSKGVFYGISLATGSDEVVRSVFEGIAYQIRENLCAMDKSYKKIRELCLFGGGSNSRVWNQIIADVTGKRVTIPYTPETACVGAAILAGLGADVYLSAEDAIRVLAIKDMYEPVAEASRLYNEKFNRYIRIERKIMF
jgi:xylulokinase